MDKSIDGVGDRIIAKLDASEKSAMQDKINALQTQLTTEHQSLAIILSPTPSIDRSEERR